MEHWKVQPYESLKAHTEMYMPERGDIYEVGLAVRNKMSNLYQAAEWRKNDQLALPAGGGAAKIWKRIQRSLEDVYFYWGVAEMMETGAAEVQYKGASIYEIEAYKPSE